MIDDGRPIAVELLVMIVLLFIVVVGIDTVLSVGRCILEAYCRELPVRFK